MPLETVEAILKESAPIKTIYDIRPYVNGDPLAEPRLHEILQLCKKYHPTKPTILYTNGADYTHIERILDPLLDELHISCSAATPETYKRIHGQDRFLDVQLTYEEALDSHLDLYMHFIMCEQNRHELKQWRQIFSQAKQNVCKIHENEEQAASHGKYTENVPETTMNSQYFVLNNACNCWNNLSIGVHGEIMQCPDADYKWNHGIYPETSLLEGWKRRIRSGLTYSVCQHCNLKSIHWRRRVAYTQAGAWLLD
jgi:hypothetical protein